jgi:hypothetical protein
MYVRARPEDTTTVVRRASAGGGAEREAPAAPRPTTGVDSTAAARPALADGVGAPDLRSFAVARQPLPREQMLGG